MQIRILRSTVAGGRVVEPGQVHDVSAEEALVLVRLRKAERITDSGAPMPPPPPSGIVVVDGDPFIEHRDPATSRRRGRG